MISANSPADDRKRQLAAIHAAASRLGMDTSDRSPDSVYRVMLKAQAGVSSAADLDQAGRKRVIRYLLSRANPPSREQTPGSAQQAKIESMWRQMGAAGLLKDPSAAGLAAFIKRMHGVDSARWLTAIQGATIVEALKAWQARHAGAKHG